MDNKTPAQAEKDGKKRRLQVVREWTESAIVALVLALVIRTFIIQAFRIPTGSMRPTLLEGDAILVNKFIYGARVPFTDWKLPMMREPKRGDIIVFMYPEDPRKDFIKRMVGVPGDTVEIRNGTIYVNDKPVTGPEFDGRYYYNRGEYGETGRRITIPPDSYFVLGDNSFSSEDSRYWGFVPQKNIRGKAMVIYWPPNRIRIIR
jgi:signal peptidase I